MSEQSTAQEYVDQATTQEYVIDTETLILTVQKYKILWDYFHGNSSDRNQRRQAWIEVTKKLVPDFDNKDEGEQAFIAKQVEMKWRHMRDNYTREIRMRYTVDTARARRKKNVRYIYADLMDFLRPNIERKFSSERLKLKKEVKSSTGWMKGASEEETVEDDYFEVSQDDEQEEVCSPIFRKRKAADTSDRELTFAEVKNEPLLSDDSDDMAFFRSLAPMLSEVSAKKKMLFRIDVMQTLIKYTSDDSNG